MKLINLPGICLKCHFSLYQALAIKQKCLCKTVDLHRTFHIIMQKSIKLVKISKNKVIQKVELKGKIMLLPWKNKKRNTSGRLVKKKKAQILKDGMTQYLV